MSNHMAIDGLHHVTAITGDAARNVDFYTRVLGLRMIAKTVNQDDPSVYHLFYGDELARPGADLTFFEYPRAAAGRPGAGAVHRVVWRVERPDAIDFWQRRLAGQDVSVERRDDALVFADPDGLSHELVVDRSDDTPLRAEHPDIPAEFALSGFEGVRAYSGDPRGSGEVLEELLGARPVSDGKWELRGATRGAWIAFDSAPVERGRQGAGSVHHVAWATRDAEHPNWLSELNRRNIPNSGLIDRHFFHSIYFREPGGILYELATHEPGFTVESSVEELGRRLILPPWLEPRRAQIEANLTPLPDPRVPSP